MTAGRLRVGPRPLGAAALLVLAAGCAAPSHRAGQERDRVRARAERGDVSAMLAHAEWLLAGEEDRWLAMPPGPQPSPEQRRAAMALLERAAAARSVEAMVKLGDLYARGYAAAAGLPGRGRIPASSRQEHLEWTAAAERWHRRAAATDDPAALRALGNFLVTGRRRWSLPWGWPDGSDRVEEAVVAYRRAAALGDAEARWLLLDELARRPSLREPGDGALAPRDPRYARRPAWPRAALVEGLAPILPRVDASLRARRAELERRAPVGDPAAQSELAALLAADGAWEGAERAALAALRGQPFDPRATMVLAACDLRRAAAGRRLNLALVALARRTLADAVSAFPTEPALSAARAVAEAWAAVAERGSARGAVEDLGVAAYLDPSGGYAALGAQLEAWLAARGVFAADIDLAAWSPARTVGSRLQSRRGPRSSLAWIRDLSEALEHDPSNGMAHAARARAHAGQRDWAPALADFERAFALGAAYDARATAALQREQAVVRYQAGDVAGALDDLDAAVAADSDRKALVSRGLLRWLEGDREGALADLERAHADVWLAGLGADPARHWAIRLAAREVPCPLFGPTAETELIAFLRGERSRDDLLAWLAQCNPDRRRHAAMVFHAHLGLARERAGDPTGAREHYRVAASSSSFYIESLWARARLRVLGS